MNFTILSAAWLAVMLLMIAASTFMSANQEAPLLMGQNSIDKTEFLTALSDLRCEMLTVRKEDFKD